jgi:hydroxymethylpyrimidine pyrophosphatase-like HAD family hydrolase
LLKFLFTDLDGTFLGGTRQDQLRLLEALNTHKIGLVYVSGRSHHRIFPAIDSGELPRPKAVIGDVGTSLWAGDGQVLSPDYETLMQSLWGDGQLRLRTELSHFYSRGLREQPLFGPYRYSLYFDDPETARRAGEHIQALGFDSLLSDNQYLDALPPGVHKGFAVNWLLNFWGLDPNNVLVAGDTLNDLAMLQLNMPAVVVANAEPLLKKTLSEAHNNPQLLFASQDGAAGIHEALQQMGWTET